MLRSRLMTALAATTLAACSEYTGPARQETGFEAPVAYAVGGTNPSALAVGDVNGDGRADIITLDTVLGAARVATGNAGGGFTAIASITLGAGARDLRVADVSRDLIADILVIAQSELRVSRGGGGGPGAATPITLPGPTAALTIGDLDGDAQADVSVLYQEANNKLGLAAYGPRASDSTLASIVSYTSTSSATATRACVADVTGEGQPDLVIATTSLAEPLVVFRNTGGPTFDPLVSAGSGTLSGHADAVLACVDLDGDGNVDVIVLEPGTQARLSLFLGVPGGVALAFSDLVGSASDMVALDANGDNIPDLAIARPDSNGVEVLLNDRTGLQSVGVAPAGLSPRHLAVADVDKDGVPDLVVTIAGGSVAVLRNGRGP